jgi:hypothetical protein
MAMNLNSLEKSEIEREIFLLESVVGFLSDVAEQTETSSASEVVEASSQMKTLERKMWNTVILLRKKLESR